MAKQVIVFVDGENLTMRYQEMLGNSRIPGPAVHHQKDEFVWSHGAVQFPGTEILRVNYYAAIVGDASAVEDLEKTISLAQFQNAQGGWVQLIPRVHKKPANVRKVKVVDVDITMDIMRAALTTNVDGIVLLSGDGDFARLLSEVARITSKQLYLGALSSGLSPRLRTSVEYFRDLDEVFFQS